MYAVLIKNGNSYGIRTRVTAVKGQCLNRLTNESKMEDRVGFEPTHAFTRLLVFKTRLFSHLSIYPKESRVDMAATLDFMKKLLRFVTIDILYHNLFYL